MGWSDRQVAGSLAAGVVEGGLLPGSCDELDCLYTYVLVLYSGGLALVWAVIAGVEALARRRWPASRFRRGSLRVLAGASYLPSAWVVVEVVTGAY